MEAGLSLTKTKLYEALDIKKGSEVIIMKRHIINDEESAVLIGKTMQGILETSPKLYTSISLRDESGNFAGNTSSVKEVRRIWRSWRFRTSSDSIYEIIPTK